MPWWPGHTLCPWHLIFTHDGLRVQRTISLRYKDTSTCCFVKFISAASSLLPFSLEALLRERAREWGANIFCRDSFNPVLRMLLVAAPWVSLGHCSWKREAAGASCSSQPGFGWIIKKFTRQVETKVLAHSWLLSLLSLIDWTILHTSPRGLASPVNGGKVLECCFQRWKKDSANWLRL